MKNTKLFTCLFGSRLYGTQTPTSDLDVKHVVLVDIDELLLGRGVKNSFKKTNTVKNVRNSADDVDEEFIPLQVFARDFVEGQTYALELAFALEGNHASQTFYDGSGLQEFSFDNVEPEEVFQAQRFIKFVGELRTKFLTSNIKAMMGYVVNQANLYSFKGERLNVARELYELFLEQFVDTDAGDDSLSDMLPLPDRDYTIYEKDADRVKAEAFAYLAKFEAIQLKYPKYFKITEYDIGGGRMRPCFTILEKTLPWTNSLGHTLKVVDGIIKKYGTRADAASEQNVDWKATMHAVRIVDEGLKLLQEHKLEFPFPQAYVDRLLAMKRGELPLDQVKEELTTKLDKLKELEATTTLPPSKELQDEFEVWLKRWMRSFYGV